MSKLATDQAGLEILHLGDCFGLLESVPVGRIAFLAGGEVVILPVNIVDDEEEGARLDALGLPPWGGEASGRVWVRIRPSSVTGRRIAATSAGQE